MMVAFCCAAMNGDFVGKQSASSDDRCEAECQAFNALLAQIDPNTAQWIMTGELRKSIFTKKHAEVLDAETDA